MTERVTALLCIPCLIPTGGIFAQTSPTGAPIVTARITPGKAGRP